MPRKGVVVVVTGEHDWPQRQLFFFPKRRWTQHSVARWVLTLPSVWMKKLRLR